MNTSRSSSVGSTFSMPTTLIRVSGRVRHMRPLPSDSTTTRVPVSAIAKFAPEMATLARRNFSRRCTRAASASSRGLEVSPVGGGVPTWPISRRKISRISARLRWMAGTRIWLGLSCPSWTMSSARSVSQALMPATSRASLRPISWVAMDLTLTTSSAPVALTSEVTMRLASSASAAQCTVAPAWVRDSSSWTR